MTQSGTPQAEGWGDSHVIVIRALLHCLQHQELLDAAHIIPDKDEMGEPTVNNGIALCKIHHAAFDRNILGIRPDLVIETRVDVLNEADGPMLRYGLQEMHGLKLSIQNR